MTGGIHRHGLRFLRDRWRVLVRLGGWSVLETGQTFLTGFALARALDEGFLAGRPEAGLAWLGVAGLGVLVGAYGTARVYGAVAALAEPLRDRLVTRVVSRGVREADAGALSGLTQQVEIARDTFAGLVMVSRSFVFTAVGAVLGLVSLDPLLLLVVAPPLAAGLGLFTATLRPLARRQETFLVADEALADDLGAVCPGLRDITAAGAEDRVAASTRSRVDAELRAACSLARWGVLRVASLALGGHLPILLLLTCAPWLLDRGVTPGALVGALAYVTQSLLPALQNLVHGLGTSGSRLAVVLRRLTRQASSGGGAGAGAGARSGAEAEAGVDAGAGAEADTGAGREAGAEAKAEGGGETGTEAGAGARAKADGGIGAGAEGTTDTGTDAKTAAGAGAARDSAPRTRPTDGTPALRERPSDGTPAHRPVAGPHAPSPHPSDERSPTPPHPAATPSAPPALSLTSVTFAYGPAATPVIDDLDLTLRPGAHLAVVGPSGIGKSTLTALVAGLLEPVRGAVRLFGRPVPGPEAAALRVLIPQEAYVFTGTLAENLGHLRPDPVPEAELLAAAEAVGLMPLLEALGGPAATVDPAALSAGERQLVALTRAYLSRAPLALLDEATCHLDPRAEECAEQAFAARPGSTLVVVAHRISSARRADRVLVMDGRRTAYGTHDDLLRRSPSYRALVGDWTPMQSKTPVP
ncbi:ATP-binding cassette domain-containing protein [Streptomyces sp. NPDC049627]|uniref:ATP-binding cassette domain-containing protein n=1 Tax=Streptomyces sp. NPDC049627 TaxID=3365595 RepID=UPI0037AB78C6